MPTHAVNTDYSLSNSLIAGCRECDFLQKMTPKPVTQHGSDPIVRAAIEHNLQTGHTVVVMETGTVLSVTTPKETHD